MWKDHPDEELHGENLEFKDDKVNINFDLLLVWIPIVIIVEFVIISWRFKCF